MSTLYYAVNDTKKQAVCLGHTGWLDEVEPTKTEQEMRDFVFGQLAKSHVNYDVLFQVEQLVKALFELGVDRVILEDWDPQWFEIPDYVLVATIYGDKDEVGQRLIPSRSGHETPQTPSAS